VDAAEDHATGQHSLVGCYASPQDAATRMGLLAQRSLRGLLGARGHALILAAMVSFYLSTPEARTPDALPITHAVLGALGEPATLAILVFRSRLLARRLAPKVPGERERRPGGAEVVMPLEATREG
jgi:hypothetical protein